MPQSPLHIQVAPLVTCWAGLAAPLLLRPTPNALGSASGSTLRRHPKPATPHFYSCHRGLSRRHPRTLPLDSSQTPLPLFQLNSLFSTQPPSDANKKCVRSCRPRGPKPYAGLRGAARPSHPLPFGTPYPLHCIPTVRVERELPGRFFLELGRSRRGKLLLT